MAQQNFYNEEFGDQTKPPILYKGYFTLSMEPQPAEAGWCMSLDGQILKTKRSPILTRAV